MKVTTFICTFSEKGYEEHGKYWIKSFIENTSNVNAIIFVDFELSITDARIKVLNFNDFIPEHKHWIDSYNSLRENDSEKKLGVVFSYKSFVMMYALNNLPGFVIWLDSDCIFKENTYDDFAQKILKDKFIAIQVDKVAVNGIWKKEEHVESGIVIFDMDHPDKNKFLNKFKELYDPKNMAKMVRPYDGFVIMRACREIEFVDLLPANYTILDVDPNLTFIHPELKQRFIHNIGNKGYFISHPNDSSVILNNLYCSILQRVSDEGAISAYASLNPHQIKDILLNSDEFKSLNRNKLKGKVEYVDLPYTIISINDRAIQNKNHIKTIMGTPPINNIKFINAHDTDVYSHFNDLDIKINWDLNRFKRDVLLGELGCIASHLECLRYIVENNIPEMIIFEDDAVLSDKFKYFLSKSYADLPKNYDFLADTQSMFAHIDPYKDVLDACLIGSNYIYKASLLVAPAAFMLYSNKGAKKILGLYNFFGITSPYDTFLFDLTRKNMLNGYTTFYGNKLTIAMQIAESLIDPNKVRE